MHEDPYVFNVGKPGTGPKLVKGMVIAIEPMVNEGKVDLVIEKDGELEIIDFKTGKLGKNIEEYKSQLRIYAMLLSEKYQRKIKKAKLFYITEKRENKIIEVPINEDEIENTIKNFDIVAKKIVNNDFEVEYIPKKLCENCILKKYCEKIL